MSVHEAAVSATLEARKSVRHRYLAPILFGLIMLFDGRDGIAIAYATPGISGEWQLDLLEMGLLIAFGAFLVRVTNTREMSGRPLWLT